MKIVMKTPTIVHTEEGLKIADTQMSLHPVVHFLKAEWPDYLVQMRFEFTDEQMADILAYIRQHPEEVEADYIAGCERVEEQRRAWQKKFDEGKLTSIEDEGWPTWWPSDVTQGGVIHIIETDSCPMISNSRGVSIYDVMNDHDDGSPPSEIRETYNLSSYQVKVALQYIEAHRERLEPELKQALAFTAERERYYREFEAAHTKWRMETNPPEMTPRRAALKALIEESRRTWGEI